MNKHVNAIAGRLSLRPPQRESLEILDRHHGDRAAEQITGCRRRARHHQIRIPQGDGF